MNKGKTKERSNFTPVKKKMFFFVSQLCFWNLQYN